MATIAPIHPGEVLLEEFLEPLGLIGKGNKPRPCRGQRTDEPLVLRAVSGKPIDRRDCYRWSSDSACPI